MCLCCSIPGEPPSTPCLTFMLADGMVVCCKVAAGRLESITSSESSCTLTFCQSTKMLFSRTSWKSFLQTQTWPDHRPAKKVDTRVQNLCMSTELRSFHQQQGLYVMALHVDPEVMSETGKQACKHFVCEQNCVQNEGGEITIWHISGCTAAWLEIKAIVPSGCHVLSPPQR